MSFFYNLNDKLNAIRATPEVTHKQLNERGMRLAAKGYEKYGKQGMEALAKAGREGKALDPIRAKYDKYDNTEVDEGLGDMARAAGGAIVDRLTGQPTKAQLAARAARQADNVHGAEGKARRTDYLDQMASRDKALGYDESVDEGSHSQDAMELNPDFAKIGRKPGVMDRMARGAKKVADFVAPGDEELLDRLQKSSGARQPVKEKMSPGKAKSFAALAPPTDRKSVV